MTVERLERGTLSIDEDKIISLHLRHGISHQEFKEPDLRTIHAIGRLINEGEPFQNTGQGGDMVAFSRPGLNFVLKFPYDDSFPGAIMPRFSHRVEYGFFLGKENLGGILAPSIDIPLLSTDQSGNQVVYLAIVQEKVITVEHYLKGLTGDKCVTESERLKRDFVNITESMWDRGVFDRDPSWEENYGVIIVDRVPSVGLLDWGALYKRGQLVLIDVGHLSDNPEEFPEYEGIERRHLYEKSLRSTFDMANFQARFALGANDDWMPTPGLIVPEP